MQLRRFTADSTPAALGAVRNALGDEAIILANRKVGDQVEIIATGQMVDAASLAELSVESVEVPAKANEKKKSSVVKLDLAVSDSTLEKTPPSEKLADKERQLLEDISNHQREAKKDKVNSDNALQLNNNVDDRSSQVGTKRRVLNGAPVDAETLQAELLELSRQLHQTMAKQNEQLTQAIEAQGAMMNQYFKGLEVNLWGNTAPNRTVHLQKLLSLGIGAELAIKLIERADPNVSVDEALNQSLLLLKSTLPIGVDKTFTVPGVTILSGPPGAGKTTALVKMATQHVKDNGSESIVIICADTRRIGAFDELQAYGRLLGVPTVHAHDGTELDSLLSAFTHKQLVLIDHTMSMDEDAVDIPKRLLKPELSDSVRQLLVLSVTSQSANLDALIKENNISRSIQCVLTHLDASARLGETFNALIRHHLPIAYMSDNASVQKPLEKADASSLISSAVAMSRKLPENSDEEWLLKLVQPSDNLMSSTLMNMQNNEVSVR